MKKLILITAALAMLAAPLQAADCFADYKAKRNDPLKLHYGVARISGACNTASAKGELALRLRADGWTLLNVLSVFDASGLEGRKPSAGNYYLRY